MQPAFRDSDGPPELRERLRLLLAHADALSNRDTERGAAFAREAAQLAQIFQDEEGQAHALYLLSYNLRIQGQYTLALDHLTHALAILEEHGFPALLPKVLWLMGRTYRSMGAAADAFRVLTRSLALVRARGDQVMEVRVLTDLASVYKWLDDYQAAVALQEQTLSLARSLPEFTDLASIIHALGATHLAYGEAFHSEDDVVAEAEFDISLRLFDEAFALAEAEGNIQLMVVCNLNRATIAAERGEVARVRDLLASVDTGIMQLHAERYRGLYHYLTGRAEALEGMHQAALAAYTHAREIYERIHGAPYLRDLHQHFSRSYEALGDTAEALAHFQQFYVYQRTINRAQVRQQAMVLAVQLDLAKARHEADMHRAQSAVLTALNVQLRDTATRDPLTGLFNRRYLEDMLVRELISARMNALPVSIVVVDLDNFKQTNDTYGHAAGDQMLRATGDLLLSQSRLADIVCRFGGEEFVVVLPGADTHAAWQWAEQRRLAFAALRVTHEGMELHTTLSAGVATFPADGDTADLLLRAGDRALYAAKHAGRNRVVASENARASVPSA